MDVKLVLIVLIPLVALLALFVGYMGHKLAIAHTLGDAETRARRILDDAQRAVEQTRAEADFIQKTMAVTKPTAMMLAVPPISSWVSKESCRVP